MKKHSKHPKIPRAHRGKFAKQEWAILGTTCSAIQDFAEELAAHFGQKFALNYFDASHNFDKEEKPSNWTAKLEEEGEKLNIVLENTPSDFSYQQLFAETDLAIINGNHFTAEKQIVFLDSRKAESLERKKDRLTNVLLIVKKDLDVLPEFLKDTDCPVYSIEEKQNIYTFLEGQIKIPPLYALILNGGKSTRMGADKSNIDYHGKPQLDHLYDLLLAQCEQIFISVSTPSKSSAQSNQKAEIADRFIGLGAFGGILSAFMAYPDAAFLVAAVDMPNVDEAAIKELIQKRDSSKTATAFLNEATDFPDPLFTIFEPRAYPKLLHYLSLGYACPRKMLINESIALIKTSSQDLLINVNTPAEKDQWHDR